MFQLKTEHKKIIAKPFLKWAGGKTQILPAIIEKLPTELKNGQIHNYYEPFLGGGAVFFYIIQNYPIEKAFLYENNEELILVYKVIKHNVEELINELDYLKKNYLKLNDTDREEYFYEIRHEYNHKKERINFKEYSEVWINRAALMIFMNKTCYNGLYRLNRSGYFNVPFGRYTNPEIFDIDNLKHTSRLLQFTQLIAGDFSEVKNDILKNSFVYFDPPYRPISKTSSFTSFNKFVFDDKEQIRLAKVFKELDKNNIKLMLSNSDPKNGNNNDNFFEKLYAGYNIYRVSANRMINCIGNKRGKINELIITNY